MNFKILVLVVLLFLSGCTQIAILTTPKKSSVISQSSLANHSEQYFWATLHSGSYVLIPESARLLTAAYLENPNDPRLAAHLGFLHIWQITERARNISIASDSLIVNQIILARKYFADAIELNPDDARYQGFYGDSLLVEGKIFNNQRQQTEAYFKLKHAIHMWPEFNYFSAGYPMSTLPISDKYFKEGLAWQWKTLDLCAGKKVNRKHPDFSPYLQLETQYGSKRACWNSWIAPHNFEGFFLNMGDMLVKNGEWQTAKIIYNNAKLSKTYNHWPYKKMLEKRIINAKENMQNFQSANNMLEIRKTLADNTILFNSGYGCVVCHQK